MLIFCESLPPRLHYAVQLVLEDIASEIKFTFFPNEYDSFSGPKIWYSALPPNDKRGIHIVPSGLLHQREIKRIKLEPFAYKNTKTIFASENGDLAFDIFSASFFIVSRYEEYWTFQSDEMGRFSSESSVLHHFDMLHQPVVDIWRKHFNELVSSRFPGVTFKNRQFEFLPTIDVDHAYAYLHKSFQRTAGALARDLITGNIKEFKRRFAVIRGRAHDPYDTYEYINDQLAKRNLKAHFFFLVGDLGEYDRGLDYNQPSFRKLIQRIAKHHEVGVHPSVGSYRRYNTVLKEKSRLEHIIGRPCVSSRQHYLLLKFRTTYRLLKATGIRHDYTMGYADNVGFRAGTARSHYWFDIKKDETTPLLIHPLVAMDATLKKYMKLDPTGAIRITENLMKEVKAVNGTFISLWHNETLSDEGEWEHWREVWEATLDMGAAMQTV